MQASRYRVSDVQWFFFDQFIEDYRDVIKPPYLKNSESLMHDVLELIEAYCGMEGCYTIPAHKTKEGRWYLFVFSFDLDDDDFPIIQYSHCCPSS